ncbi:Ig-like domain-containing protein [Pseudomonas segetis]|uniref:Ig-like domain (Group 3) n=1 Tax=Pseudomonas segetis TaxID=298908 RepID=A0A239AIY1_9PSED|nr:Ig-like domain-containing protein [Pseudomonas segetis]SNR95499.1 Ig-like domain (group 3) [Pseudomonas segetis]
MKRSIEVIDRAASNKVNLLANGSLTLTLNEPSVVLVQASISDVRGYERDGNDLLIHMKDGSVIRCDDYFKVDETQQHSELVFQDQNAALIHVSFAEMPGLAPGQLMPLTPQVEVLNSIDPLLYGSDDFAGYGLLGLIGAGLGGALVGAGLDDDGGGHDRIQYVDNSLPAEVAQPSFIATDNQGQLQTLLTSGSRTDDLSPTFSGSGEAGANIQIINQQAVVVASAEVGADGTWTVTLADQALGQHSYEVIQHSGDSILSAGRISIEILGNNIELAIDPISGDNQLGESEAGAPLSLSGSATGLESGTQVMVSIAGERYITQVDEAGGWRIELPVEVVAGLHDGFYTAQASATDPTGNSYAASQGFFVDTSAPVVSINAVALDDVLNASEVTTAQTISGSVMGAEAGQTVRVDVGGTLHEVLLGADHRWAVDIPSAMWTAMGDGALTITASITDAAGNTGEASRGISIAAGLPGLRVSTLSGDDVINAIEHAQDLAVFGTSSGLAPGQTVTVTIAGESYLTAINADGSWQIGLQASDVSTYAQGPLDIHVSSADASGDPVAINHQLMVDLADTAVSINAVAQDSIINSDEQGSGLLLSGATANVEAGQVVVINFAGHQYQATVAGDGEWAVAVPAADLAGLSDGYRNLEVQVTNTQGSVARSGQIVEVDLTSPILVIDPTTSGNGSSLAQDDLLNSSEVNQDLLVSGVTSAQAGQPLTISLNGQDYQAVVGEAGAWSLSIPSAIFSSAPDGPLSITATTTDKAGNRVQQSRELTVDTAAPVISINSLAGDDIINANEKADAVQVSGHARGLSGGEVLTVSLNGKDYTTAVGADGDWGLSVAAADIAALPDGQYSIVAQVADAAGNGASTHHDVELDTQLPTIRIDTVAGDNVINSVEKSAPVEISGSSTGLDSGAIVSVVLNGKDYQATVAADGNWSTEIQPGDFDAAHDGQHKLSASAVDDIGNQAITYTTVVIGTLNAVISIDTIAGDDRINAAEAGASVMVSGSVLNVEPGQVVNLSMDGSDYTATVNDDLSWAVSLPSSAWSAAAEGSLTIDASVSSVEGNNAYASRDVVVDFTAPVVTINSVAGDDVINASEHNQALEITGGTSGLAGGEVIRVSLEGRIYATTVNADGSWGLTIPRGDVAALPTGTVSIDASVADTAGNLGSASHGANVVLEPPIVTIGVVSGDDVISAAEKMQSLDISGTSSGLAAGTGIEVSLNGRNYSASVDGNGAWSVSLPDTDVASFGKGDLAITAQGSDAIGNLGTSMRTITVDGAVPTITIDPLTADNTINSAEAAATQILTGNVTGVAAGQALSIEIDGQHYSTSIDGNLNWSLDLPGSIWNSIASGTVPITATVGGVTELSPVTLDVNAPAVSIDTVASDNVIDGTEQKAGQVISGTTDAEPGQIVEVAFNGRTYHSVVADDGAWRVNVDARDFLYTPDGNYTISAAVTDQAGNSGARDASVSLQGDAPSVTIDSFTVDDILSKLEQGSVQVISGTSSVDVGRTVTLTLNGKDYSATVQADHGWSLVIGTTDLAALVDSGVYTIHAAATDSVGNTGFSDRSFSVDLSGPSMTLTIDSISQDTGSSSNDFITHDTALAINGTLGAALGAGELMQISLDGGASWIDHHVSGTAWTYIDNRVLVDGNHDYAVRVIDSLGNLGSTASQLVTIDTSAPASAIAITSITDDTGLFADYITQDTSLRVNGSLSSPLAVDERAQITLDSGVNWTDLSVAGTSWNYVDSRALVDGSYQYTARVIDAAGNIGSTYTQTVVVDTAAPLTTISIDSVTDDTGGSATDYITRDNSLMVNGTLSAALHLDEVAQISLDAGVTWISLVPSGLTWSYTDGRSLSDGFYSYQVRVVDLAGNSGPVEQQIVRVDHTAPTTLVGVDSISDDTGLSATDFVTRDTSLTLSGTLGKALESDEYAQISIDGGATWTTLTDVHGIQWSYADSRLLNDGNHSYQLRVIDQAGNMGPMTSQEVVVDTTAPLEQATITGYYDDQGGRQGIQSTENITDDTAPVLRGGLTAELQGGEVLRIFQNGIYLGTAAVSGTTWTYALSGLQNANSYDYQAVVTDAAGNTTTSTGYTLNVDTSAPGTVTLDSQVTSDTTPVLRGTLMEELSAGQVLYVEVDGITYSSSASYGDGGVVIDPENRTWYLQIPGSHPLGLNTYDVIAQVVNEGNNGNLTSQTFSGAQVVVAELAIDTQWAGAAPPTRTTNQEGLGYSIGENGLWNIVSNTAVYRSSDLNAYSTDVLVKESLTGNTVNYSYFDLDRDGDMDIFATQSNYTRPFQYWQNDSGSYTSKTIAYGGLDTFYGGTVAYDRTGNGYLDLVLGDSNLDSYSAGWFNNNQDGTFTQDITTRGLAPSYTFGASVSGVDINNDGTIDITAQINGGGASNGYALGVITNNGDGSMSIGQVVNNVFNDGGGVDNVGTSMTWADFNGDGNLDLYLNQHFASSNKAAVIINNNGTLDNFVEISAGPDIRSRIALAVDWDHNGTIDIAKMGGYNNGDSIQIILNNGNGLSWTDANLDYSYGSRLTGAAALDYDWDGAVDLIGFTSNGNAFVVENSNTVAEGTSLHLRILDQNGINAFYGNTVQLFDSGGALVSSQILNPQSGVGVNDSSALLNFYGLSASETYSVKLVRIVDGVRADVGESLNTGWGSLTTGDAAHNYVLSAEAGNANNDGAFIGTGYNDTFMATAGSDAYNGAGGWNYSSGHGTWVAASGGMDIVDYGLANSGVTVDLSSSAVQDTGFNLSQLVDIEGVSGSDFDETFTGSTGDNLFNGRGGNDIINISNGGHDTLIYKLLNTFDPTLGNGSDSVHGFTIGTWEGTDDTDRIDISELLNSAGYTGTGSATYVDGVATLDASTGNIEDYLNVLQNGANTEIQFDHDGLGSASLPTTVVSLSGVQVDLATLLANHQLLV